jgi:xylan 1,4-beta-xylosidase
MFSRMSGDRLRVQSDAAVSLEDMLKTGVRDKPDISALAARDGKRITILAWHYHDDDLSGPEASIMIQLTNPPEGTPKQTRTLIDESHSNSFIAWLALASPQKPSADQIRLLEEASRLTPASDQTELKSVNGNTEIRFKLARQGVTLLELEWP